MGFQQVQVDHRGEQNAQVWAHDQCLRASVCVGGFNWPAWFSDSWEKRDTKTSNERTEVDLCNNGEIFSISSNKSWAAAFGLALFVPNKHKLMDGG